MATKTKTARVSATKKPTPSAKSAAKVKATKPAAKAKAAKAVGPKAKAKNPTANGGGRKPSSASRFKEHIMEGRLTDDKIFAAVQKEFPSVTDDKRYYVGWYRGAIRRAGGTPPEPK